MEPTVDFFLNDDTYSKSKFLFHKQCYYVCTLENNVHAGSLQALEASQPSLQNTQKIVSREHVMLPPTMRGIKDTAYIVSTLYICRPGERGATLGRTKTTWLNELHLSNPVQIK